jgi:hypothetical protein
MMKEMLPDEDLQPTHTPLGVDATYQAETLRRLRELENTGRRARFERDDLIVANALSNSLSRPDMGRAIGVSRSRIDQIISSHYAMLQERRNVAGAARVARHMPPGGL